MSQNLNKVVRADDECECGHIRFMHYKGKDKCDNCKCQTFIKTTNPKKVNPPKGVKI